MLDFKSDRKMNSYFGPEEDHFIRFCTTILSNNINTAYFTWLNKGRRMSDTIQMIVGAFDLQKIFATNEP